MAQSKAKAISFDDYDASHQMTDEKKKKIASFKGNPKLIMPTPGDKTTDVIIRPIYAKDDEGNDTLLRQVATDSPKVPSGTMDIMTVERYDDQDVIYDMNYSQSINNEFIRFTESRGLKRSDIAGKWFKLSAETYENKQFGESTAYRLRYMEDLNSVVKTSANKASQMF